MMPGFSNNTLMIDSGASIHICSTLDVFIDRTPFHVPIIMADDTQALAVQT
eukprot:Ihof_evm6s504 gene=Ihof_evmTU6s504